MRRSDRLMGLVRIPEDLVIDFMDENVSGIFRKKGLNCEHVSPFESDGRLSLMIDT